MYTVCLESVSSMTMDVFPTWFSTIHLRPTSSRRGGPVATAATAAGRLTAETGTAPKEASA